MSSIKSSFGENRNTLGVDNILDFGFILIYTNEETYWDYNMNKNFGGINGK